jgi:hypothetical protein
VSIERREESMKFHLPAMAAAAWAGFAAPAALPQAAGLDYQPILESYRPFRDETPIPWIRANDDVGRIGGWRAYAREVQGALPAASAARPAASVPAKPHGGHHN